MSDGALQLIGVVVSAILVFGGIWLTQRQGGRTAKSEVDQRDRIEVMKAWQDLVSPINDELARVRERADKLEKKVEELSNDVDELRNWRYRAIDYIRTLLAMWPKTEKPPPAPPMDLELHEQKENPPWNPRP